MRAWQDGPMRALSRVFGLVFLGLALVAAYGFFTDDEAVQTQARGVACAGRGPRCTAGLARLEKTALWRDLQFHVGRDRLTVRCVRAAYIAGAHRCRLREGARP